MKAASAAESTLTHSTKKNKEYVVGLLPLELSPFDFGYELCWPL